MVNWLKNMWGKIKGYVIALAGAVFGALCLILGLKSRKIDKLEAQKAEEEARRKAAEKAAEKARIDAQTAATVAAGSAEIDAKTEAQVAAVAQASDGGNVTGKTYNEVVEVWNEGLPTED